ncbi:MAG: hypothetical protein N3D10_03590 [Candidatus Micrarchaeota archaeon]|nr:hypothetical protein [Candidatus Micrarchaeota archaeon]
MKRILFFLIFLSLVAIYSGIAFSQQEQNQNATGVIVVSPENIESPWAENSKICVFVREWVLKGAFLFIILVFIAGVATFSGAAFAEWRNYGVKMILGPIAAVILYIIGISALNFFMGGPICGLKVF